MERDVSGSWSFASARVIYADEFAMMFSWNMATASYVHFSLRGWGGGCERQGAAIVKLWPGMVGPSGLSEKALILCIHNIMSLTMYG